MNTTAPTVKGTTGSTFYSIATNEIAVLSIRLWVSQLPNKAADDDTIMGIRIRLSLNEENPPLVNFDEYVATLEPVVMWSGGSGKHRSHTAMIPIPVSYFSGDKILTFLEQEKIFKEVFTKLKQTFNTLIFQVSLAEFTKLLNDMTKADLKFGVPLTTKSESIEVPSYNLSEYIQ